MKTHKNKKTNHSSKKESKELEKMDEELKDLIDKNESLKIGITKIIDEIEKNNTNTDKSN